MGIETQSQVPGVTGPVPVTTPTFSGAPVPGVGQGQQNPLDPNQKAKQILATLLQAANRKQMANTAVPSPIPGMTDPNEARSIGMNTAWPHAWGTQRFLAGLAGNIKNAVAKQKESQLLKAEGDWTYLQSAMNELYAAQQSGDQQAAQLAQKKLDTIFGDNKKLKNMAKALNQDWLNPEKTTVYGEALKKVAAQSKQKDQAQAQDAQQKQQAATGLKGLFQKLIRQRQQPQLSDEQKKAMAKEIQEKAPVSREGIDPATARELLKEQAQAERDAARDKAHAEEQERKDEAAAAREEKKEQARQEDLEMTHKFQAERDRVNNAARERIQTLRDNAAAEREHARDLTMLEALGMKLDAQQKKLFEKSPKEKETELQGTITDLSKQLAQAQQNMRSLKTQASNHFIMGPGKSEISDAQSRVDDLQKGLSYLEKNRDAVIKGDKSYADVVEKAYSLMGGEDTDEFVPDKKK